MKTQIQKGLLQNGRPVTPGRQTGFTLVELLVVIAIIGILAAMLLPAMIRSTDQARRAKCASNLKQLIVGSIVYADDYGTLPPWRAGMGAQENDMTQDQYSRWVYSGPPNDRPPMGFSLPPNASFHNMGYLYGMKLAGNGGIFYCPALKTGPYSEGQYSPLLTCDSGGAIRSSYNYNPRMVNADPAIGPVNTHRAILKSAEMGNHRKVFGMDVITGTFAHARDQGWNVLFTDSSVKFCKGTGPGVDKLVREAKAGNIISREQLYNDFEGR